MYEAAARVNSASNTSSSDQLASSSGASITNSAWIFFRTGLATNPLALEDPRILNTPVLAQTSSTQVQARKMLLSPVLQQLKLVSRDVSIIRNRVHSYHGVPLHANVEVNRGSAVIEQPLQWTELGARTRPGLAAGIRTGLEARTRPGFEAGTRMGRRLLARGKSTARSNAESAQYGSKKSARFTYDWKNLVPQIDLAGYLPPARYVGQQNMVRPIFVTPLVNSELLPSTYTALVEMCSCLKCLDVRHSDPFSRDIGICSSLCVLAYVSVCHPVKYLC